MRFDYFLETKSLGNITKRLKNGVFKTPIPISTKEKIEFDLVNQLGRDRFLFDYTKAYFDNFVEDVVAEKLRIFEFCLLLFLEKKQNYSFSEIFTIFKEIKKGKRPLNNLENRIFNIIYTYEFIRKPKIILDENNFEMFIHVLLQNLEFDLDIKSNYYRLENDKTILQNVLLANQIDNEFNALFEYIKDVENKQLSGYTKAYILFIVLILISAFKNYNLTFSTLLTQWFSFQKNDSKKLVIPLYQIAKNWNNFLINLNSLIPEKLVIDTTLSTIKHYYIQNINMYYHASHIYKWIKKDAKNRMWLFEDDLAFLLVVLMFQQIGNLSLNNIKSLITINKIKILTDIELEKTLDKLITRNIISKTSGQTVKYSLVDKNLAKAKYLVK
ncbi:hypothetical protein [Mycoplasma putrefaciens]|uniref:Fido domain-containing protein n=1 Tax=Mycoplasma putrefaciens Mput9231 TaxID=1292033 RepID=M9WHW5_9MOLU|nr:hypothetical protein [Mycoplasma putrefaciens]AGJ91070.1 Hypothetical protein MPUT9231_6770 [Mycoplasma putrefaciens Mput9231]